MRILLLNANTNPAMTDHCLVAACAYAPDIEFTGATGRFGSPHIGTRATYAIAAHAALDAYAAQTGRFDAVVLACFGDPGCGALKEIADVPVFGLAEAACRAASWRRQLFSIVTGGERWASMLTEHLTPLGLTDYLASIRTVDITGSQILADPDGSIEKLAQACGLAVTQDGAASVILGGAGLVGLAPRVQGKVAVPVLDCLYPAIDAAREAAGRARAPAAVATPLPPSFPGIGPELSKLLAADIAKKI
ncbi:MAG: aspartate/glutamate racemase family protein [Pseudolabrys sp.]|jgi:Asp/Glu/hydantoin racemase